MQTNPLSMFEESGGLACVLRRWCRVLLVEDDGEMRSKLADLLRGEGYVVEIANGGVNAARTLFCGDGALEDYDLILIDQRLPDFDGVSLAKAVRRAFGPPVILMAAFANEALVAEGLRAGAYAVLTAPLDLRRLMSLVHRVAGAET